MKTDLDEVERPDDVVGVVFEGDLERFDDALHAGEVDDHLRFVLKTTAIELLKRRRKISNCRQSEAHINKNLLKTRHVVEINIDKGDRFARQLRDAGQRDRVAGGI